MTMLRGAPLDIRWPNWMLNRSPVWSDLYNDLMTDSSIRVEEFQEGDHYVIRAEVPGVDPDKDIDVTINDSILRIAIVRKREERSEDHRGWRSEFSYGSFTRTIALPSAADMEDVVATYDNGVLDVRVPLNGKGAKEHRIAITHK
jgi:HSP20 family protein